MGCETQYERENQKGPGETKGDTEKLRKFIFCGGKQVFSMFFGWCTPTKKVAQKKERKKISSHMLQTRVFKKPYVATPPLDQKLVIYNLHCSERRNLLMSNQENENKKEEGSGNKKTGNPKNEQGKMKNIFN